MLGGTDDMISLADQLAGSYVSKQVVLSAASNRRVHTVKLAGSVVTTEVPLVEVGREDHFNVGFSDRQFAYFSEKRSGSDYSVTFDNSLLTDGLISSDARAFRVPMGYQLCIVPIFDRTKEATVTVVSKLYVVNNVIKTYSQVTATGVGDASPVSYGLFAIGRAVVSSDSSYGYSVDVLLAKVDMIGQTVS
jgi:hypothetical protein